MCYHFDSNSIIAIATVAYTLISVGMWLAIKRGNKLTDDSNNTTRAIFEATNRPLVYSFQPNVNLDPYNKNIGMSLRMGNAGAMPTRGLIVTWRVTSGQEEFHNEIRPAPYTPLLDWNVNVLLEGEVQEWSQRAIIIVGEPMTNILAGKRQLEIRLAFSYKGLGDHAYKDSTTYFYDAINRRMTANLDQITNNAIE